MITSRQFIQNTSRPTSFKLFAYVPPAPSPTPYYNFINPNTADIDDPFGLSSV